MARSEAARTALLDTAERLFAQHGVASVSDRRVADEAGNTNHSAVRYYFGDRDGLLRALLERHTNAVEAIRIQSPAEEDTILGDIRTLVMPSISMLATLPRPSWRARFTAQSMHEPGLRELKRELLTSSTVFGQRVRSLTERLSHLDRSVVQGRAILISRLVLSTTAEYEAKTEREGIEPCWPEVGSFLADAIAGMLSAPVTNPVGSAPLGADEL
ncbi:TetR/AcrR family transcriptional regulator [Kineosporia babensis]|uniref:TetR/AcrR family transcriptional regulator n=1 Tax=Kineosporia babensis TaxID=499548 RepID=A0A9X1T3L3_9ACTN|nr:TetR/AcrR family transcriptional regulator [Kineosporia babensis]MCD5315778.1 TetR/AcrR family transcriptional regulator [Kineosporia babensis]